jgi:hypothetical protein
MGAIVRRCLRSLPTVTTLPWVARHTDVDGLQKLLIFGMMCREGVPDPKEIGFG